MILPMFQLTQRQRENIVKAILTLIAVDMATFVFNPKGLPAFTLGCIILGVAIMVILTIDK